MRKLFVVLSMALLLSGCDYFDELLPDLRHKPTRIHIKPTKTPKPTETAGVTYYPPTVPPATNTAVATVQPTDAPTVDATATQRVGATHLRPQPTQCVLKEVTLESTGTPEVRARCAR